MVGAPISNNILTLKGSIDFPLTHEQMDKNFSNLYLASVLLSSFELNDVRNYLNGNFTVSVPFIDGDIVEFPIVGGFNLLLCNSVPFNFQFDLDYAENYGAPFYAFDTNDVSTVCQSQNVGGVAFYFDLEISDNVAYLIWGEGEGFTAVANRVVIED